LSYKSYRFCPKKVSIFANILFILKLKRDRVV